MADRPEPDDDDDDAQMNPIAEMLQLLMGGPEEKTTRPKVSQAKGKAKASSSRSVAAKGSRATSSNTGNTPPPRRAKIQQTFRAGHHPNGKIIRKQKLKQKQKEKSKRRNKTSRATEQPYMGFFAGKTDADDDDDDDDDYDEVVARMKGPTGYQTKSGQKVKGKEWFGAKVEITVGGKTLVRHTYPSPTARHQTDDDDDDDDNDDNDDNEDEEYANRGKLQVGKNGSGAGQVDLPGKECHLLSKEMSIASREMIKSIDKLSEDSRKAATERTKLLTSLDNFRVQLVDSLKYALGKGNGK